MSVSIRSVAAWGVAVGLVLPTVVPVPALAASQPHVDASVSTGLDHLLLKKRRKRRGGGSSGGLSPEAAGAKRDAVRDSVSAAVAAEDYAAVSEGLEEGATQLGDPVTMLEAGEARLKYAEQERSIDEAERSIEITHKALDIAHFYRAVARDEARTRWMVIKPTSAQGLIMKGEEQVSAAEQLIAEIEAEQTGEPSEAVAASEGGEPAKASKKKKKQRGKAKRGTGLLAGGAVLTVVGVGGAALGVSGLVISSSRQNEVEGLDPTVDGEQIQTLDDEGQQANLLGWIGLGVGVGALAAGLPMMIIGIKRRKEAGPSASAQLQVMPSFARDHSGLVVSGRF